MKIKWLGHSAFLLTSQDGKKIIVDPYTPGRGLSYAPINESADIVTKSHDHADHNNVKAVGGNPAVLVKAGAQTVKGLEINAVSLFHDESGGSQRGTDLVFCFKIDGLNVCHLGDLGHRLSPEQISEIGKVDILLIPVGGFFTIDARTASDVAMSLNPKLIFPMHYKTSKAEFPIAPAEDFLKGKKNVRKLKSSEYEVTRETLPEETEIIVLQSAN
jgi:L-ascorbate metabolism protein UlaG (beta-lactamase superfamily)